MQIDIAKVAPYLKDPLVLIGFGLFLGFLFVRLLVKRGLIPTLTATLGFRILKLILLYGFILGLLITLLGFALKYKELQQTKNVSAHLIANEILDQQKQKEDERKKAEENEKSLEKMRVEGIKSEIEKQVKSQSTPSSQDKKKSKPSTSIPNHSNATPASTILPFVMKEVDWGFLDTMHISAREQITLNSSRTNAPMRFYGGDDFEYSLFSNSYPSNSEREGLGLVLYIGQTEYRITKDSGKFTILGNVGEPMRGFIINPRERSFAMKFRVMSVRTPVPSSNETRGIKKP